MPVFQNAKRNAEFHRASLRAFRDPAPTRFDDREDLLVLRDHFPLEQTAVDQVDLAQGMREMALNCLDVPGIGALPIRIRGVASARWASSWQRARNSATRSGRARRVDRTL